MGCASGPHNMGAPPGSLVAVGAQGLDGNLWQGAWGQIWEKIGHEKSDDENALKNNL